MALSRKYTVRYNSMMNVISAIFEVFRLFIVVFKLKAIHSCPKVILETFRKLCTHPFSTG